MGITRWRDDLDGTWHESGDLDGWNYEQEAREAAAAWEEEQDGDLFGLQYEENNGL